MKKGFLAAAAVLAFGSLGACATLEEEAIDATSDTYNANLTGAAVVGGGDADGSGMAEISISDAFGQVCYEVKDVRNIGAVTGAHIHFGKAGVAGPPVLTLTPSNEGTWQGCKDGKEWTENRMQGNPQDFYVQLHTAQYPNGAIRGQLYD